MDAFPVMLRVRGRRAVVVGGGKVAARRAASLAEAGAAVTVIAPALHGDFEGMGVTVEGRPYREGDLAGAFLVVAATDDPAVNDRVCREAHRDGVLVNRADDPDAGDVTVPAHARLGPLTVAVHSGGISARAAAMIRDRMIESLDKDWVTLLETVEPFRGRIQERVKDTAERQAALRRLTDAGAMEALKTGGTAGLREYCEGVWKEHNP